MRPAVTYNNFYAARGNPIDPGKRLQILLGDFTEIYQTYNLLIDTYLIFPHVRNGT